MQIIFQVVYEPTRSEAILDLVFLSNGLLHKGVVCETVEGISDHRSVLIMLPVRCAPNSTQYRAILCFMESDDVSILDTLCYAFEEFENLFFHSIYSF